MTMRTIIATLALLLATPTIADAKPRKAHASSARLTNWMRDCITERTGPDGGIPVAEARKICKLEQPEDEVALAKLQLSVARASAKMRKAQAKARKALLECEQAVTDLCIEEAGASLNAGDCNTELELRAEYQLVCLAQGVK